MNLVPRHKNIVGLIAAVNSTNNMYLLMEHCNEGDLKEFIS